MGKQEKQGQVKIVSQLRRRLQLLPLRFKIQRALLAWTMYIYTLPLSFTVALFYIPVQTIQTRATYLLSFSISYRRYINASYLIFLAGSMPTLVCPCPDCYAMLMLTRAHTAPERCIVLGCVSARAAFHVSKMNRKENAFDTA